MAKVNWSPEETELFVDLCLEEVTGGSRVIKATPISKEGWYRIHAKWNAHFGQARDLDKFKNKWDSLKKEWKDLELLLSNDAEIGWNPVVQTIDASEEWWERQKQAKSKFYKYKNAPFTLYEKCTSLFKIITTTTGSLASTPSRLMPDISHMLGDEGSDSSDDRGLEDLPVADTPSVHDTPLVCSTPPVGEALLAQPTPTTAAVLPTRGTKRRKVADASKLTNNVERMRGTYETKLSTSVNQRSHVPIVDEWSIEQVIDVMMTLPGLDTNSLFFTDCLVWMDNEYNRRTFLKVPTPEMKLNFLRSLMRKSGWGGDGQ